MLFFYSDFLRDPKRHPDFSFSYIKSHTRAAAYCVGMIAGYIYYRMKDKETRLSKVRFNNLVKLEQIEFFYTITKSQTFCLLIF